MDWLRDLPSWPLSDHSRQVYCKPHRWHVQEMGDGPLLLLLHGAGASTHSWRDVLPRLARTYRVVAIDLPGQGFTRLGARGRAGLKPTTEDIAQLCKSLDWKPEALIGHSAGAALALNLSPVLGAPAVIGINAALGRFDGVAGWLFPLLAKILALNPFTALAFTMGGDPQARARRLIESTGSRLSDEGLAYYARLISDRVHVDGTLQMMSQWEIDDLVDSLPDIPARTFLLTGAQDRAVAPTVSERAALALPNAVHETMPDLGHLAHEEAPEIISARLLDWLSDN